MCRPRSAPTRPRVRHGTSSNVGASSTGCGVLGGLKCRCGRHVRQGERGGRPARRQGRARCVRVLIVAAARRRRGSAVWRPPRTHPPGTGRPGVVTGSGLGLAPPSHASPGDGAPRGRHRVGTKHTRWWRLQGVHGQRSLAPPRTHSPRTGHPGVVTGSGLSTRGGLRPGCMRMCGQRENGGACQAPGERGGGGTRCVVLVRCRQRGRQSCGMPLILERREHPGTFLGVTCPFGTQYSL